MADMVDLAVGQPGMFRPNVETRSRDEQIAHDEDRYRKQVGYLFAHSDFYRAKLREAGFADAGACGGLDHIAELPFTGKDEIRTSQAAYPPFGNHLAADVTRLARIFSTSGTTGDPCYMPVTEADLRMWVEISSRSYFAAGLRPGMQVLSTFNAGPFVAGAALDAMNNLGVCHIPVGTGNTARLVRALELIRPAALLCTPSYAAYLVEHLRAHAIAPAGLGIERICVAGEPGGGEAEFRQRLQADYGGAKLCEAMGIGDISVSLWGECDQQAGMHFNGGDFVHVELIDPQSGAPVPVEDGATGELVYTALQREAVPLLRFRSRDHVVCHTSACACGRRTMRVRCIGRTDDMLIVRGVNLFPSAVRSVVAQFAPRVSGAILVRPKAAGVRQEPPVPVQVELAAGRDGAGLASSIEKAVRTQLVATITVELVEFGTLKRSEYKTKLLDFDTTGGNP